MFIFPFPVHGTVRTFFTGYRVYPLVIGQYKVNIEHKSRTCPRTAVTVVPSTLNHKNTPPNIATI